MEVVSSGKKESTKHWIADDTKPDDEGQNKIKDQFASFQKAMKVVIVWGQCIGLNPVTGILQKDVSKMRFTKCSFKFLWAMIMAVTETIGTVLCMYRLFKNPNNLSALGKYMYLTLMFCWIPAVDTKVELNLLKKCNVFLTDFQKEEVLNSSVCFFCFVTFFMTSCLTTISFIRAAPKWPPLMKELVNCRLDEYIHPNIVKRCKIACAVFMGMSLMEHIMSIISRIARILECPGDEAKIGEVFLKVTSPWLYELNVPYIEWLGIIVQYLNLMTTATWNYADIFIVCISLYFTSILEQINKKIVLTASKNYVPATTWSALRDDYTRATNLVRLFDDVFSGLVLVTFANDLFFICLQLYNVLANGVKSAQLANKLCPGHQDSVFRTYVYPVYLAYSTIFLCFRFLTVALVASGVHSSSLVPLPVLYAVPTTSYSKEVERFHNQVNGDTVALSGLHFFYITRDLVLTVAGTIVTYELVLLQFSNDDK